MAMIGRAEWRDLPGESSGTRSFGVPFRAGLFRAIMAEYHK